MLKQYVLNQYFLQYWGSRQFAQTDLMTKITSSIILAGWCLKGGLVERWHILYQIHIQQQIYKPRNDEGATLTYCITLIGG